MSNYPYLTTHDDNRADSFVCDCKSWVLSACRGEPFYKELNGKRYCVFHYPGKEKADDFREAIKRKLEKKDYDLWGFLSG